MSRASVKKSSGILKISLERLGTSQDVEIVEDSTSAQIKEIFAQPSIPGTSPLPSTDMRECMLNRHSLTQFVATFWCLLILA
jgi:hypothetical protein